MQDTKQFQFDRVDIVQGLPGKWGQIGSGVQSRTDWFDTEADAKVARFARTHGEAWVQLKMQVLRS